MDLGLAGKLAVVTGASKGIGLAITRAFVDEGAQVIAGSRDLSEDLRALVDTGRVWHVAVDLSTPAGPGGLIDAAAERGSLDILVNNVGALTARWAVFSASPTSNGRPR